MADERLRALEREWAASGTLAVEVRLLAHRVRAGELAPVWLETAARLGHAAARRALERQVPLLASGPLRELIVALGTPAIVRALAAWASVAASVCPSEDHRRRARAVLDDVQAWIVRQDDAGRARCDRARRRERVLYVGVDATSTAALAARFACGAEPGVDRLVSGWERDPPGEAAQQAVREALATWALGGPDVPHPGWPGAPSRAGRAALDRFEAELAGKVTRDAGAALRARVGDGTLAADMLDLAADAAHPAAWLAAGRSIRPDLSAPLDGADLTQRTLALVEARAQAWPAWGGRLLVRAGLAVADAALQRPELADVRETHRALEAAHAYYACPCAAHADLAARAATPAPFLRRTPPDADVVFAAARLPACVEGASAQDLREGCRVLLDAAERTGQAPAELWDLLRTVIAAWALGEDALGAGRALTYAASRRYAGDDVIDHPTFGRGRVERVERARIHVAFSCGVRVLRHASP